MKAMRSLLSIAVSTFCIIVTIVLTLSVISCDFIGDKDGGTGANSIEGLWKFVRSCEPNNSKCYDFPEQLFYDSNNDGTMEMRFSYQPYMDFEGDGTDRFYFENISEQIYPEYEMFQRLIEYCPADDGVYGTRGSTITVSDVYDGVSYTNTGVFEITGDRLTIRWDEGYVVEFQRMPYSAIEGAVEKCYNK